MYNIRIFNNKSAKFKAILITGFLFFALLVIPITFCHHCNLPKLFTELPTYAQNQNYNQFFNTSKHKKIEVTQEKLTNLVKSLDLCLVHPWAFRDEWTNVIPSILELSQMIYKYIEYLKQVNIEMEKVHSSTTFVRDGIS